jgi:heme A synthase
VRARRFTIATWAILAYNILVILWGALVRAVHAGDGCGQHWPLCHGALIPKHPEFDTYVELIHRVTSGVAALLVLWLAIWAWRAFPKGHLARVGALGALALMVSESLLGAGLVLFALTGSNSSSARALVVALHLVNTFLLLGALTLTAWWAQGGGALRLRGQGRVAYLLGFGLLGMLLLGSSGALTALADTLFPAQSLAQGLAQKLAPDAHFLVRLRILHPIIAFCMGLYLLASSEIIVRLRPGRLTRRLAQVLIVLFVAQGLAGALNVLLLVPLVIQLLHLLFADLVWITLVLLSAAALAQPLPARSILERRPLEAQRTRGWHPLPRLRSGRGRGLGGS